MNIDEAHSLMHIDTAQGEVSFFSRWLPYVFERIEHPRFSHVFLPLNRHYAPLGLGRGAERDTQAAAVVFSRDPATFKGVWLRDGAHGLYLYDDDPRSRLDYFERLGLLLSKKRPLILDGMAEGHNRRMGK